MQRGRAAYIYGQSDVETDVAAILRDTQLLQQEVLHMAERMREQGREEKLRSSSGPVIPKVCNSCNLKTASPLSG